MFWKVAATLLVLAALADGQPLGRSAKKATHVKPTADSDSGFNWRQFFALPNTYHERPRHRYRRNRILFACTCYTHCFNPEVRIRKKCSLN